MLTIAPPSFLPKTSLEFSLLFEDEVISHFANYLTNYFIY